MWILWSDQQAERSEDDDLEKILVQTPSHGR